MARSKRVRLRTLIVVAIVLLLLAALGAGFEWVYDRGLKREGLFERAARACREGRYGDAVNLAHETLVSEPGRDAARELLLEALVLGGRYDDAEAEARRCLDENPERTFAAVRLCQLALRKGNGDEAERLALGFADREPAYAYHVLAVVRDQRGLVQNDWRQRLDAAATMRSLGSLTDKDSVRAEAIVFSAEVNHEVAPALPQAELLGQRVQADLKEATAAVNAAVQADKKYPYDTTMGRIRILSEDPEEAALGAKMLRTHTTGALKLDLAICALAKYHVERGEWKEAADLARSLEDTYLWQRLCWTVRRSSQPDQALALLEGGPLAATADGVLLRDELLIRSADPARRAEALKSLAAMVEDPASPPATVVRALILLASGGGVETALVSAERARLEERHDPRFTAILASLLAARGSEHGLELAEQLARETDDLAASRDVMRLLGGAGDAFDRYVDTQVGKGGDAEIGYRLQRSLGLLAQARKDDPQGAKDLRQRVRKDLEALRASERATKPELVAGFQLAASLGEAELAGALLARGFTLPGLPALLDSRVLGLAREMKDRDAVARLAAGIRTAAQDLKARAFLDVFADAMAAPQDVEPKSFLPRFEEAAKEPGSRLPALEVASSIAFSEGDLASAERLGRAALAEDPHSARALEVVGATLLRRGATEEVLAFYGAIPADQRPEASYGHIVRAQLDRGHKDEALVTAHEALRRFPASAASHLLLAQLYRDLGEPRKALSVLSLAPGHPLVVHMRAELLRQVGDPAMAERLYQVLLSSSRFTDLVAWQGLKETLTDLKRTKEFVILCERALGSTSLKEQPKAAASVRYMRGVCLELDGKIEEALADYEEAIRLDGTNGGALNNAAWHIARSAPARIADARAYVDRAMKLSPDNPAVLDTAAEVYSVQNDPERALNLVDRAIELAPKAKVASYTVHKAEILCRGEREEEAKALLQGVRQKYGDDPAAQRARSLLWEIERRHLPEEEPVLSPEPPEDKEQGPGDGGGEQSHPPLPPG